jgi:Spy/CpxP family protein refolding chaperone
MRSAIAAAALAMMAGAYAQPFGGMGPEMGPGMGMGFSGGMGMGPGHGWRGAADHDAMVDARLAYMKSTLKITAAQEQAWNGFAAASKAQAAGMDAWREKMWASGVAAPDRMALRAEAMQQHAAGLATTSKAFATLYAVLTPEQRTLLDEGVGMAGRRGPYGRRLG